MKNIVHCAHSASSNAVTSTTRIPLLILNGMTPQHLDQIGQRFDVCYAPTPDARAQAIAQQGARFRAVLTIGAVGLTAHGPGTARAFLVSEEMGAFSALGMGLNGVLTAVLLPLLLPLLIR